MQSMLVDKVPELESISSISAENTTNLSSQNQTSLIQCNEQWKFMKLDAKAQQQENQKKIDGYVKEHLFKKVKFFNLEMMCFSTHGNSICQMVCKALNIIESEKEVFWTNYSGCVKKSIKVARNDAVAAMKLAFFKGNLV